MSHDKTCEAMLMPPDANRAQLCHCRLREVVAELAAARARVVELESLTIAQEWIRLGQRAERAEADLAAARADAERYRWLRDKHEYNANAANIVQEVSGEGWDAAIDAAITGENRK